MNNWEKIDQSVAEKFLILMAPVFPHLAEELWHCLNRDAVSIFNQRWPRADTSDQDQNYKLVVQINGKKKATIVVSPEIKIDQIKILAQRDEKIKKFLADKKVKRVVAVGKPIRLINFVL